MPEPPSISASLQREPSQPTVIVVHERERASKCTVEPLRGRPDLQFCRYPLREPLPLPNYVRLGLGGPELSRADRDSGLLVLDGTWRWAAKMEQDFADVPVRSLPAWQTAYPRRSKMFDDPDTGLATVEALYVAYCCLGYATTGLLDAYYWKADFLRINAERLPM